MRVSHRGGVDPLGKETSVKRFEGLKNYPKFRLQVIFFLQKLVKTDDKNISLPVQSARDKFWFQVGGGGLAPYNLIPWPTNSSSNNSRQIPTTLTLQFFLEEQTVDDTKTRFLAFFCTRVQVGFSHQCGGMEDFAREPPGT